MDKSTLIRTGVAAGAAAIGLSLGGISLASAADSGSDTGTTSQSTTADDAGPTAGERGPGGPGGRGGPGGPDMDAAALAEQLGLDEAEVTAALEAVRDQLRPDAPDSTGTEPTPPTEAERTAMEQQMAAALAEELGVSEAKVTEALTTVREQHQAEHRDALSSRLDEAVTSGDLTAADKASVLKAYDAGVLGGGPGGMGGPRG